MKEMPRQKHKIVTVIILFIFSLVFNSHAFFYNPVLADELEETQKQKEEKEKELIEQQKQLEGKKAEEGSLAYEYNLYQNQLGQFQRAYEEKEASLKEKETLLAAVTKDIENREKELIVKQEMIAQRIRSIYKKNYTPSMITLLSSTKLSDLAEDYAYRVIILREDKKTTLGLGEEINQLALQKKQNEELKQKLEQEKAELAESLEQVQAQIASANSRLQTNRSTQSQLSQQLLGLQTLVSSLSQKEQEILAAKAAAAAANNTVGNNEQQWNEISQPAPGNGGNFFSFWTYGYPHRVGMNQYGAYGRALAGQTTGEIIHAYYADVAVAGLDQGTPAFADPAEIKVDGYGWIAFDTYLKGIGEMPSSWPSEALKTQAIAARTYALNYINYTAYQSYSEYRNDPNARSICTTQSCQVYLGHPKEASWQTAVDDTKGMVILAGGVPITAWYASTAGGSTLSSQEAWGGYRSYALGVIDVDAQGNPYDGPGHGDSPWFHKAWGDYPWLSKEEVRDLVNAALLPDKYNNKLLSQANGGFSPEEVVETLQQEGIKPAGAVQSVIIGLDAKQSTSFQVWTETGMLTLDPQRFRLIYNLRSPGTDAIWTTKFDVQTN